MENPTPVFDQLLFAQLALSETLGLTYAFESGWSGCEWQAALPDCFRWTGIASESVIDRRIRHYVHWSLANNCRYTYTQPLFLVNYPEQACARVLTFEPLSASAVHVTIEPLTDYADVILSSELDQTLLNSIRDAILVTEAEPIDQPGPRVLYVNGVFERMSGYTSSDIVGLSPRILHSGLGNERARGLIRASLQAWQPITVRMDNVTKDGKPFEVELSISPVTDMTGWRTHWISVQRDVTQEIIDETEQARSRMILRNSGVGTWRLDLQSNSMAWDEQMYALFEIDPTTQRSDYEALQRHLHPDDARALTQAFTQAKAGEQVLDIDIRILTGQHNTRYLHVRAEVSRDEQGGALSMDGVCLDITPRRQNELERRKQQEFAIHQDRLASIGELAAGVGHEVNNPLSIVIGFAEQLEKLNNERFSDPDIAAGIKSILSAADRIGNIVSGLRTFTHFDQDIELFSLTQVAHDTTQLIQRIYQHEGVQLTLLDDLSDGLSDDLSDDHVVRGNRGRIQQVLLNLLANAKDATEGLPDRHITVGLQIRQNFVELIVNDNGCGIDEQSQSKIFDTFFTTKPTGKGTGIGLSISDSIVLEHGGTLTFVTSEQGTAFSMLLPKTVDEIALVITDEEAVEPVSPHKLNVFVVDDEPAIRDLLAATLKRAGMVVTAFSRAEQALAALVASTDTIDMIISDIQMPDMSGLALVTAVRLNPGLKQPRLLLMTGGDKFEFSEANGELADLIDGVLYKPFRMHQILNQVLALFEERV
ncbi:MAG: PAS domain S-box-containing protein [Candidatus Azotimanducaceae bacterium]|jgi:PAS domain S-box-containing protein